VPGPEPADRVLISTRPGSDGDAVGGALELRGDEP
jgi:hypothetical protein